jgi:hypothetical protein
LEWGHILPIEKNSQIVAAKVIVYAGDEEEYFSFITSEAYNELKKWMDYRKESGEDINNQSWVMRNIWDTKRGHFKGLITIPKKLKASGVKRLIEDAIWAQGLRRKLATGKRRHEFQADHGFRKRFKTRCEIAGMKSINIETLMGHSIGISDSYYRATEEELLQDYLKAADCLSISSENTLKLENQKIKQSNDSLQREKDELYFLRKELTPLLDLKNTLMKEGILREVNNGK